MKRRELLRTQDGISDLSGLLHRCAGVVPNFSLVSEPEMYSSRASIEGPDIAEHRRQDLSGGEPVLDLRAGRIPQEPRLFARLDAGEVIRIVGRHP